MANKRTRREKKIARLRRLVEKVQERPVVYEKPVEVKEDKMADVKAVSYVPTRDLPIKLLKLDLTKAVGVTILALILQISLTVYLHKGGWEFVNKMLFSKILT